MDLSGRFGPSMNNTLRQWISAPNTQTSKGFPPHPVDVMQTRMATLVANCNAQFFLTGLYYMQLYAERNFVPFDEEIEIIQTRNRNFNT